MCGPWRAHPTGEETILDRMTRAPLQTDPGPRGGVRPGTAIRRELLLSTTVLFAAAVLLAVAAAGALLPLAPSPGAALVGLTLFLLAELAILYFYLRSLLRRTVLEPVERIVAHAERIAGGDFAHRIPREGSEELDRIVTSVNYLASRLIREQERLAENVASLDRTNRELSEATRELVRAARLASVGTLAAGVAHEIGNPLSALRGYLDAAGHRAERPNALRPVLADAREELDRIDAIIRHILAFGRPPSEGVQLPRIQPEKAVRRAVELLEAGGEARGVPVRIEADPDLPPVRAQPQHLERVVSNLVRNAVAAMQGREDEGGAGSRAPAAAASPTFPADRAGASPEAGHPPPPILLTLRAVAVDRDADPGRRTDDPPGIDYSHRRRLAELLRITSPPPADAGPRDLVIEVRDHGPGIPEEDLARVFDPFFTTREPGEGTGMGLALTARIVGELGGTIEAENAEGGGARFTVWLPGVEEEA